LQSYLVAVIVPEKSAVEKWAAETGKDIKGFSDEEYQQFINGEEFKNYFDTLIKETRKNEKLSGLEVPKAIFCTSEEFSVENDLLTPTFKLKRNEAKKKYLNEIKAMYKGEKLQGE